MMTRTRHQEPQVPPAHRVHRSIKPSDRHELTKLAPSLKANQGEWPTLENQLFGCERWAGPPQTEAYTVKDAIVASGIGRTKLYEELSAGRLKSFVLCGRRLIMRDDLLKWLLAARDEDRIRD